MHDSMDDFGGEALTLADVLRILLGVLVEVRVDDAEVWQVAGIGVSEKFVDAADMHHVPGNPERVQSCRELQVTLHSLSRALERSAERPQVVLRRPPPIAQVAPDLGLVDAVTVVVDPGLAVLGEHVQDSAGRR